MIKSIYIKATILTLSLLCYRCLFGQEVDSITGKVVSSSNGEPCPGVSVIIQGTTTGTMTDALGGFCLSAPTGSVLEFSCVGMKSACYRVTAKTNIQPIEIELEDDTEFLDEVVVVGYGVQKKQSVVGAISQVNSDDISKTGGVTNISSALTGLVPGLATLNYSGKPGEDSAEMIIRAKSTWNGSAPLVLVDGIEREMNDLDVSEVESISVLKDASATAVFGVRGGNGVILVTTKRGKSGKPTMSVSVNVIAKSISKMPKHLGSYDALRLRNIAIENQLSVAPSSWSYITPIAALSKYKDHSDPLMYPDVDWPDEMLRKCAWSQRYNWDVRGGTKHVKYYGSLSYLYDGDILKGRDLGQGYIPRNDYSRFNYRLNIDFIPIKGTTISVDIDGATGIERSTNAGAAYLWRGIYYKGPDQYPVRYDDGTFANNENGYNMYNPVELLNYSGMSKETRMDTNITLTLNQSLDFITKGLSLKGIINFRNYYFSSGPNISASRPRTKYIDWQTGETTWNTPSTWNSAHGFEFDIDENIISSEKSETNVYKNLMYQVSANYGRDFGKHYITALAVFKRIENATGSAFASYREEWAGRLTYDYDGRYLIEVNGAYNGSEKFAKGNKFGFFPSAAAGWIITEEPWLRKSKVRDWLDLFKVRYSWGKVGSDNNIPKWLYVTQWKKNTNPARLGYPTTSTPPYPNYQESNIGNGNARWETSIKNDIAIETAFLGNKLSFNVDYFWGRRYDIFMNAKQRNIPPWFGAEPVAANIGKTKEHGVETELRWQHKLKNGFSYYITGMFSYAKDLIIYMEDPELAPRYQKKAGYSIGQQTSILSDGIISSWDQMYCSAPVENNAQAIVGTYRQVDYNGDGIVDTNDIVPFGYTNHPQYSMSISLGGSWKNISMMIQLYGTRNCTLIQAESEFSSPHYYNVVDTSVAADMWLPLINENGTHHVPTYMLSGAPTSTCQYYLKDGSQWRIKTVELSYKIDNRTLKHARINNISIFLNGNNLYLYSHLNEDRETGGKRDNTHISSYPMTKRYNLGIKVEF